MKRNYELFTDKKSAKCNQKLFTNEKSVKRNQELFIYKKGANHNQGNFTNKKDESRFSCMSKFINKMWYIRIIYKDKI